MSCSIVEYLGKSVEQNTHQVERHYISKDNKLTMSCPFRYGACDKAMKGYKPICSVRDGRGDLWITCEHRLCSTTKNQRHSLTGEIIKDSPLIPYQKNILTEIATEIYGAGVTIDNVKVKREVPVPVEGGSDYKADFVMVNHSSQNAFNIILEMQGGGETTNTGIITQHVTDWEQNQSMYNSDLAINISKAGTLVTNAWRRQQEQFLVKGNVVTQTGGRIVFAVGTLLYDYIYGRIERANLRALQDHGWTLALIAFRENGLNPDLSVKLEIDHERKLYTNYSTFVRTLTDQGAPCPELFYGPYIDITD